MAPRTIELPPDPDEALRALRAAARAGPVLVFKRSPICPVSFTAEAELGAFLEARGPDDALAVATIDVIEERPLARGLTAALGVRHESPQALVFRDGELAWHASHGELTRARFAEVVSGGGG